MLPDVGTVSDGDVCTQDKSLPQFYNSNQMIVQMDMNEMIWMMEVILTGPGGLEVTGTLLSCVKI